MEYAVSFVEMERENSSFSEIKQVFNVEICLPMLYEEGHLVEPKSMRS